MAAATATGVAAAAAEGVLRRRAAPVRGRPDG
jgi:hypothetical protein